MLLILLLSIPLTVNTILNRVTYSVFNLIVQLTVSTILNRTTYYIDYLATTNLRLIFSSSRVIVWIIFILNEIRGTISVLSKLLVVNQSVGVFLFLFSTLSGLAVYDNINMLNIAAFISYHTAMLGLAYIILINDRLRYNYPVLYNVLVVVLLVILALSFIFLSLNIVRYATELIYKVFINNNQGNSSGNNNPGEGSSTGGNGGGGEPEKPKHPKTTASEKRNERARKRYAKRKAADPEEVRVSNRIKNNKSRGMPQTEEGLAKLAAEKSAREAAKEAQAVLAKIESSNPEHFSYYNSLFKMDQNEANRLLKNAQSTPKAVREGYLFYRDKRIEDELKNRLIKSKSSVNNILN